MKQNTHQERRCSTAQHGDFTLIKKTCGLSMFEHQDGVLNLIDYFEHWGSNIKHRGLNYPKGYFSKSEICEIINSLVTMSVCEHGISNLQLSIPRVMALNTSYKSVK